MTRNQNTLPQTSTLPQWRRLAVATAGVALLLAGCSEGTPAPDSSISATTPDSSTPPQQQRNLAQVECWKHPKTNIFIPISQPNKYEVDLVKKVEGKAGIVARLFFDVDTTGMKLTIDETGEKPLPRGWTNHELQAGPGDRVVFGGKTVIRYPVNEQSGIDTVAFTLGCNEIQPADQPPQQPPQVVVSPQRPHAA